MKVAIITNYWKNSDGGGIKTYLMGLVDALKGRCAGVSVIFRSGADPDNFKSCDNKILFVLKSYFYLRKIHPDLIQTQAGWYGLLPGVLYKKLHGCTLVHTFHTEPDRAFAAPGEGLLPDPPERLRLRDLRLEEVAGAGCRGRRSFVLEDGDHLCGGAGRRGHGREVKRFREQYGIRRTRSSS